MSSAIAPPGSFVSEPFRFVIRPSNGFRLVAADLAYAIDPRARAAATARGSQVNAVVLVDRATGTLTELTDSVVQDLEQGGQTIDARTTGRFAGEEAVRIATHRNSERAAIALTYLVFLHQGYVYKLLLWGRGLDGARENEFLRSFDLIPGPVVPGWRYAQVPDQVGDGWRVHGGRFESADVGIAMDPGAQWQLVPRAVLQATRPFHAVAVVSRDPEVLVTVLAENVPVESQDAYRNAAAERVRQSMGLPSRPDALVVNFPGGPPMSLVQFERHHSFVAQQVRCERSVCLQVMASCPAALADAARNLLTHAPPGLAVLDDTTRASIARQAVTSAGDVREADAEFSVRGSRYVNYAHGITIDLPRGGAWRVLAGQDARERWPRVSLFVATDRPGLHATLVTEEFAGGDGTEYHARVRRLLTLGAADAAPMSLGAVDGLWSRGQGTTEFGPMDYRIETATRGDRAFRWIVGAYPGIAAASSDAAGAVLAVGRALEIAPGPLPDAIQDGERFIDAAFGYAIRIPSNWSTNVEDIPGSRGLTRRRVWRSGEQMVAVTAIGMRIGDADTTRELMLETVLATAPRDLRDAAWHPLTLAGRTAWRASWDNLATHIEATYTAVDRVGYSIRTERPRDATGPDPAAGFELLDL